MDKQPRIAIVEDSLEILQLLSSALTEAGYKIDTYSRAVDFERALPKYELDLCIIDLGLPDKDGLSLLNLISTTSSAAILVISGRSGLQDKIVGLELGADDYLAKPFEIREVVARVRALTRRRVFTPTPKAESTFHFSGWTADFAKFMLTDHDGNAQRLSASEASLLQIFLARPDRLITRAQLQTELDDRSDSLSFDRAIDVRVSRLRAKLKDSSKNPEIIKTIYGAGYIFVSDIARHPNA